jgi:hypothetical protein
MTIQTTRSSNLVYPFYIAQLDLLIALGTTTVWFISSVNNLYELMKGKYEIIKDLNGTPSCIIWYKKLDSQLRDEKFVLQQTWFFR